MSQPSFVHLIANPPCLVGPAIWLQSAMSAKMHRRLLINAWPSKPRWQWALLLMVALLCWYLFFCWRALYLCRKSAAFAALKTKGIGKGQQWLGLLHLGLCYGANPRDYYAFKLYAVDAKDWSEYVFSQEQLTWHRVFSCPVEGVSSALVNDKHALETRLRKLGIQTPVTLAQLQKSVAIDTTMVFQARDLFIKPNTANAMRGCLKLSFDAQNNGYRLCGFDLQRARVDFQGKASIQAFLNKLLEQQSLLVQEKLANSDSIQSYLEPEGLVTFKAISAVFSAEIVIGYLFAELPAGVAGEWNVYPIDLDTGIIKKTGAIDIEPATPLIDINKLKSTLLRAHELVPDINALSWDLCLTDKGLCIIEANTGWGVAAPQQLTGRPLLASGLYRPGKASG